MTTQRENKIVVGVDGSEGSLNALRWALDQAALAGSEMECVYAWDYPLYWGAGIGWIPPEDMKTPEETGEEMLREIVAKVAGPDPAVSIRVRSVMGGTARSLVEAAADAALLVVGNRGHGPFAEVLLGSVSLQVVSHARCPVVVVHET